MAFHVVKYELCAANRVPDDLISPDDKLGHNIVMLQLRIVVVLLSFFSYTYVSRGTLESGEIGP